ncbi:MAG: hypothetical protein ABSB59_29250 [Streptosporangiaceae bacterium]|jgi:hypothetical protein
MTAKLLLVHSPLVGSASWDPVAADLARRGYEVGVPDLTGTVTGGPPYVPRQAEVIARAAAGQPAILIGHSGAGPLLARAGAMAGQAQGYVFVDAGLPIPGQSWMDTVPPGLAVQVRAMADAEGWLPPWSQWWGDEVLAGLLPDPRLRRAFAAGCPRLPLAMFEEVHPPVPRWPATPGAYLQLSDAYEDQAARARELGWPVARRMSHHLALLTEPDLIAGALAGLIGLLG